MRNNKKVFIPQDNLWAKEMQEKGSNKFAVMVAVVSVARSGEVNEVDGVVMSSWSS